ncbi:MAG TPA: hydroxyisourate hydrolase [Nitrospira sp.]|nr:hydroxyisourate hydrolase [Nitrospira sp.]
MSGISTHVLDVTRGKPVGGMAVVLEVQGLTGGWKLIGKGLTDADGRSDGLFPSNQRLQAGTYRMTFDTRTYFESQKQPGLYPEVSITFTIRDAAQSYHLPLLLSPFGYTTYRGS